ncbi:MAG: 5-formyltetrahydrofolate cyclo-ligase [Clostridiales bacterium]|nr:5-formyltetrahydrofolate cyclo-ligase [Clostridiales bacterium]
MMRSKDDIRKAIYKRRSELDDKEKSFMDDKVFKRLIEHKLFKSSEAIFIYVSFDGEVDTHRIIDYALDEGKIVCVPKIHTKEEGIMVTKIDNLSSLIEGYFGILEPPAGSKQMDIEDMDLIIMPGLAFDEDGNRVGYGGGFYDRLLAKSQVRVPRIALSYTFQLFNSLPSNRWDEKIDIIITDKKMFRA